MLSDDEAKLGKAQLKASLSEVSTNLTRALEVLEDVPVEAFAHPEDRLRLQELIARAGQIVASELARGEGLTLGPCTMPDYSSGRFPREEG